MLLRRLRWMLDEVVVCTTGDPTRLPEASLPAGYSLRTLDALDVKDARAWLAVHNAAFERAFAASGTLVEEIDLAETESLIQCKAHLRGLQHRRSVPVRTRVMDGLRNQV